MLAQTYHLKLVELKQSLIHSRLVDLKLFLLLPQSLFKIPITFPKLGMNVVKGARLLLYAHQLTIMIAFHGLARPIPEVRLPDLPSLCCTWPALKTVLIPSLAQHYLLSQ